MSDQADRVARAAAQRLAPKYGPTLAEDVEVILQTDNGDRQPGQYFDPISIASLVVSVASLGWTICKDLRKKTEKPAAEVVARRLRLEIPASKDRDQIIDVVVDEIVKEE